MTSHDHNTASGNAFQINGNISGGATFHHYQQSQNLDEWKKAMILTSLYYDGIDARRQNIPDAAYRTFKWLLDRPSEITDNASAQRDANISDLSSEDESEESFENFEYEWRLEEEKVARNDAKQSLHSWFHSDGSPGLFWIAGKAASGKSTLMKCICEDSRTEKYLMKWAGDKTLVVAQHYFWHPGSPMQKSRDGLLKSLLHQICQQCPIDVLCPRRWKSEFEREWSTTWTTKELWRSILRLDSLIDFKVCLFIDGLDEYHPQDAHDELCDDVRKLAALANVKLCVSSRPWRAFQVGLQHAGSIRLESVNRFDLMSYAGKRIRRANPQEGTRLNTEEIQRLVKDLVDRAEGVFLWLHLVMNSLCERLRTGTKYIELEEQLSDYPPDLEDYLRNMIYQRIHSTWTGTKAPSLTALFLKLTVILRSRKFQAHWIFHHIAEQADQSISILSWSPKDIDLAQAKMTMERKVNASCGGLLFINEWTGNVEYTHRTVHDFITSDEMQFELDKNLPQFLCDKDLLLRLTLAFFPLRLLCTDKDHLPNCFLLAYFAIVRTPLADQSLLQKFDRAVAEIYQHLGPSRYNDPTGPRLPRLACVLLSCGCYSFATTAASAFMLDAESLHQLAWATLQRSDFDINGLRRDDINMLAFLFLRGLDVRCLEPGGMRYEINWNNWVISNATNSLLLHFVHLMVSRGGTLESRTICCLESLVSPDCLRWLRHHSIAEANVPKNRLVGKQLPEPAYDKPRVMGSCASFSAIRAINEQSLVSSRGPTPGLTNQGHSTSPEQCVTIHRSTSKLCLVLLKVSASFGQDDLNFPPLEWEGLPYNATHRTLLRKAYEESNAPRSEDAGFIARALIRCMAFSNETRRMTNVEAQRFLQEEVLNPLYLS